MYATTLFAKANSPMTLRNVVDHRQDTRNPDCDAILRPSIFDHGNEPDCQMLADQQISEPTLFCFLHFTDTTVRQAILDAEAIFPFAITVSLFDKGTLPRPLDDPEIRATLANHTR